MDRRQFLSWSAVSGVAGFSYAAAPSAYAQTAANASQTGFQNLLILVELKGANDGLNTVIPFTDPTYYALRPRIAVAREQVLPISERQGFHPSLKPLHALWEAKEVAVIEGVGYAQPNLSHFRSIEIWDTASRSDETLQDGWLARLFSQQPVPSSFAADGVVVGGNDMGPLAAGQLSGRSVAIQNPEQFLQRAKLLDSTRTDATVGARTAPNKALAHIVGVENNILAAAQKLHGKHVFQTSFPTGDFGNQVRTAAQIVASNAGVAVLRLSLGSFDTHQNQPGTHANLLKNLAEGLVALKSALVELKRWDESLVMTYCEFGRRPKENQSQGTDHGTANVQFALGGRVQGGVYGAMPNLTKLDGGGNVAHAVDFRQLYATVAEKWWNVSANASRTALGGRFEVMNW